MYNNNYYGYMGMGNPNPYGLNFSRSYPRVVAYNFAIGDEELARAQFGIKKDADPRAVAAAKSRFRKQRFLEENPKFAFDEPISSDFGADSYPRRVRSLLSRTGSAKRAHHILSEDRKSNREFADRMREFDAEIMNGRKS